MHLTQQSLSHHHSQKKTNLHPSCFLPFLKRKSFFFRKWYTTLSLSNPYGLNKKRPEASQSKSRRSETLSKVNGLNFIEQRFDVQKMKPSHLIAKLCWFNNESGRRRGNFSMNINSLCKFSSRITDKSTISLLSVQIQMSLEFTRLRVVRQKGQDWDRRRLRKIWKSSQEPSNFSNENFYIVLNQSRLSTPTKKKKKKKKNREQTITNQNPPHKK